MQDLSTGWLHCDPGPLFKPEYFTLPGWFPDWVIGCSITNGFQCNKFTSILLCNLCFDFLTNKYIVLLCFNFSAKKFIILLCFDFTAKKFVLEIFTE